MAQNNNNQINITFRAFNNDYNKALTAMNAETRRARQEMQLTQEQLRANGTESEKLEAKLKGLEKQQEIAARKTELARQQLERAKQTFGENSVEAGRLADQLLSLQIAEQRLANQVTKTEQEVSKHNKSVRDLNSTLALVEGSLDDFADVLGNDLVQALNNGTANSKQIERAISLIGRTALGAQTDLTQLRAALNQVDNGANIDAVRADLQRLSAEAQEAQTSVGGLKDSLAGLAGGAVAGVGLAGTIEKALDVSSLNTKIAISFDIPEESINTVEQTVKKLESYGVEGEEALEGIRRQFALNKDASAEANASFVEGAGVVAKAYAGIDLIELIQETNEFAAALEISNDEALAMTNVLMKGGFPPEQLDILSEYGLQMKMIGFNSAEIQAIFEKGVDTKSWNIDNLNDGVKEAKIVMMEFGLEVPKAVDALLKGTDLSSKQLQEWGKAVAGGGKEGAQAMADVSAWLRTIEDDALRNELAIAVFGTKAEDQGDNLISVFEGIVNAQDKTVENQNELQAAMDRTNADPLNRIRDAINQVMENLRPTLTMIAEFTAQVANWVAQNAQLSAALIAIATVIGIVTGAFAFLMPAIGALVTTWPILAAGISSVLAPIALAVVAIGAIGVALVALWQNSETFRTNVLAIFEAVKTTTMTIFEAIAKFIGEKIAQILAFWQDNGPQILAAVEVAFNAIKNVIETVMPAIQFIIEYVWSAIKNVIDGALNIIMGLVKTFSSLLTGDFSGMWEGIKQVFSGAIDFVTGLMSLSFVGGIRTLITNLSKTAINLIKTKWTTIVNTFKTASTNAVSSVKTMVSSVITFVKNLATNFVSTISSMKTQVVNKMIEIKNGIVGKVKEIDLLEIGKDIVRGLIKGISAMTKGAIESITGVVDGVINKAKSLLGIASPSKVFKQIGKWTGEGLAEGITNAEGTVEKSLEDLGYLMLDVADHYVSEQKKVQQQYTKDIEKLNKDSADKIAKSQSKSEEKILKIKTAANKKKRSLTVAEKNAIKKIESESAKDIEKLKTQNADKILALEKKSKQEQHKLLLEADKEYLATVQAFVDDRKSLGLMSITEEARIWEESANLFSEGTKERIKAQQNYKKTLETINKEITDVNEKHLSEVQRINDDLIKNEQALTKAYDDELNRRYQQIVSTYGLFDEVGTEDPVSKVDITKNLQDQVMAVRNWSMQIEQLKNRNISDGLLDELQEMGPKAIEKLRALNSMTDFELTNFQSLYSQKMRDAKEAATKELEPMKADTQKQIEGLREAANIELDKLNTQWNEAIRGIVGDTDTELQSLESIGKNAGEGLLKGLSSTAPSIQKKAKEIANSVSKTMKNALQIKSPSRVTYGFGVNVNEGFVNGLDKTKSKVAKVMGNIYNSVPKQLNNIANGMNLDGQLQVGGASMDSIITHNINNKPIISLNIAAAPIYLDGDQLAEATFETIGNLQHSNVKMAATMRGVNQMG